MNLRYILNLFAGLSIALLLASCAKEPAPTKAPAGVAQVGDVVITPEAVQQKLAERQRVERFAVLTAADRDAALDELVQFEALFAQANRAGWSTNAELLASFKRTVVAKFKEEQLTKSQRTAPSDAELRAFYQQNAARFIQPERLRAAVVVIETPSKATDEKRTEHGVRAAELRRLAVGPQVNFAALARQHSVDQATRYLGGDFGLLTREEIESRYGDKLSQALAALQAGETTTVVETPRGLAFAKLLERQGESRRPLAEVRDVIAFELVRARQSQAERDLVASAKQAAQVTIHRAALERIPIPNRNVAPPSLPGAETAQLNP